jgi:hypothetical protein
MRNVDLISAPSRVAMQLLFALYKDSKLRSAFGLIYFKGRLRLNRLRVTNQLQEVLLRIVKE